MSDARILIVEDEGIEALALEQTLIRLGYPPPEMAFSGPEALGVVEKAPLDLVLMDIMLHGQMDGIMVAEQIRSRFDIPVIYITAYADEETLCRAKVTEPYGYIIKPFRERELQIVLEMALYKHKMEQKIRKSEYWFSTTLRSIGDAVIATDNHGLIEFMNPVSESLLGWKLEEVRGKSLADYFRAVSLYTNEFAENPIEKAVQDGDAVELSNRISLLDRNNRRIPIDLNTAPIRDDNGKTIGVVLVFRDVTARKRAEEALRKSDERHRLLAQKLREADRRKNQFITVLSHELRNPLAVISNCLAIMDRVKLNRAQVLRAKETIQRQVKQLARLVEDLLDVARLEQNRIQLHLQIVELNRVVWETIEDYQPIFQENGICLKAELASSSLLVNADRGRLKQIIGNLLHNAVKFNDKNGHVTVFVDKDVAENGATIRVVDDGVGISPEIIPHLFEPYIRVDKNIPGNQGGLGIGLALAHELVVMHGGRISVSSDGIGRGSEFTIWLPILDQSETYSSYSDENVSMARRRVLIIDDNVDLAESLAQLLALNQHEVAVAYDSCQGINKAHEFHPEVVLCDIGLSQYSGYEVAKAFRQDTKLKDVYLVALSGYAMPEDQQRAAEAGFDCHLAKPVDLAQLEKVLAKARQLVSY